MALNLSDDPVLSNVEVDSNNQVVDTGEPAKVKAGPVAPAYDFGKSMSFSDNLGQMQRNNINAGVVDNLSEDPSYNGMSEDQFDKALELGIGSAATGADMEDALARDQGFGETMIKGTTGFAARVLNNTVGGIIGGMWGVGAFAASGIGEGNDFDFTKLYQNDATDIYDDISKSIDDNLGINKSREFQNAGFFEKMTNPGMFMDEFGNAIAFTVGAIATEYLSAGMSSYALAGQVSKMSKLNAIAKTEKLMGAAANAKRVLDATSKAAKMERSMAAAKLLRQTLLTGSAFEAGVETRQAMKELSADLKAKGFSDEEIADTVASAEKYVFFGNVAIVGTSNAIQFSGLFKGPGSFVGRKSLYQGSKDFVKRQANRMGLSGGRGAGTFIKEEAGKLTTQLMGSKRSMMMGVSRALANPLSEGLEEASQGILSGSVKDRYSSRGSSTGEAIVGRLESFTKNFEHQFGTKQGRSEVLMGALVGALGRPGRSMFTSKDNRREGDSFWEDSFINNYRSVKKDQEIARQTIETINNHGDIYSSDKLQGAVRASNAMQDYIEEVGADGSTGSGSYDNFVYEYMLPYVKHGYGDMARANVEVLRATSGEDFVKQMLAPEDADRMINDLSTEELDEYRDAQIDEILSRIDALDDTFTELHSFDQITGRVREDMQYLHYKTKSIPISQSVLYKAISKRFSDTFASEDSISVDRFNEILSELVNGGVYDTNADGDTVLKQPHEYLDELESMAKDLLNNKVVSGKDLASMKVMLKEGAEQPDGLTKGQGAVAGLMHSNSADQAGGLVAEIQMMNSNDSLLDGYINAYNMYLANKDSVKKMMVDQIAKSIMPDLENFKQNLGNLTTEQYTNDVEKAKEALNELDPVKHKDLIDRATAELASIQEIYNTIQERAKAAKEEIEKIKAQSPGESSVDSKDTVTGSHKNSNSVADPYVRKSTDTSGVTENADGELPAFTEFVAKLKAKNIIPSKDNSSATATVFRGTFDGTDKSGDMTREDIKAIKEMDEDDFVAEIMSSTPGTMGIRLDVTIGGEKFATYMNTSAGKKDHGGIESAARILHASITAEYNNNKDKAKWSNISPKFPHVNLSKGLFIRPKDAAGKRVIEDIPLAKGFKDTSTSEATNTKEKLKHVVVSNSEGEIVTLDKKELVKEYIKLKGSDTRGKFFIKGVDAFGRNTLFKVNNRRLSDAPAEALAVNMIMEAVMSSDNESLWTESDGVAKGLLTEIKNDVLPGTPYNFDTLESLLSSIVYHGKKTQGAGEFKVFTKGKALLIGGKMFKFDTALSKEAGRMVFHDLSDAQSQSVVGALVIGEEIGKLRQQVSISSMSENRGDNDYARYMMNNVLVTDIPMKLEANKDGKMDFSPILEKPKLFVARNEYLPKTEEDDYDIEDKGIHEIFSKLNYDKKLNETLPVSGTAIGEKSMREILESNGSMKRWFVSMNNTKSNKISIGGVEIPNGVIVRIVGNKKGLISYKFHYSKDKAKYDTDTKTVEKALEETIAKLKENDNVYSAKLTDIMGVGYLSIQDNQGKGAAARLVVGGVSFKKVLASNNRTIITKAMNYYKNRGKNKKGNDKALDVVLKAILYPNKKHTDVTEKMIDEALDKRTDILPKVQEVLATINRATYNRFLSSYVSSGATLLATFNRYTHTQVEVDYKGLSLKDQTAKVLKALDGKYDTLNFGLGTAMNKNMAAALYKMTIQMSVLVEKERNKSKEAYEESKKTAEIDVDDTSKTTADNTKTKETKEDKAEKRRLKIEATNKKKRIVAQDSTDPFSDTEIVPPIPGTDSTDVQEDAEDTELDNTSTEDDVIIPSEAGEQQLEDRDVPTAALEEYEDDSEDDNPFAEDEDEIEGEIDLSVPKVETVEVTIQKFVNALEIMSERTKNKEGDQSVLLQNAIDALFSNSSINAVDFKISGIKSRNKVVVVDNTTKVNYFIKAKDMSKIFPNHHTTINKPAIVIPTLKREYC